MFIVSMHAAAHAQPSRTVMEFVRVSTTTPLPV